MSATGDLPATLAIDTASTRCQCALALTDGRAMSAIVACERGHAEILVGQIQDLLAGAGIGFEQLGRVAVTVGPGSFTGVRVGLAAARGFGLALGVPVLGVPSLVALSLIAPPGRPFVALAEARRGQFWRQVFAAAGEPLGLPEAVAIEVALSALTSADAVIGSAAARAAAETGATDLERERPEADRGFVDVVRLAGFAQSADPAAWPPDPVYVRPPDAKPQTGGGVARRGSAK